MRTEQDIDYFAKIFPKLNQWDHKSFKKIYFRFNSPLHKKIAKFISFFADPRLWAPLVVGLGIYGIISDDFSYTVIFLAGFLQTYLTYDILKLSIKRPRPFHQFEDVERHDKTGFGHSFPSGHCHHSAILIGLIGLNFCQEWWFLLIILLYNGLIAFSRMINGLHFPSDCIFGILEAYIELVFFWTISQWWYLDLFDWGWNLIF